MEDSGSWCQDLGRQVGVRSHRSREAEIGLGVNCGYSKRRVAPESSLRWPSLSVLGVLGLWSPAPLLPAGHRAQAAALGGGWLREPGLLSSGDKAKQSQSRHMTGRS